VKTGLKDALLAALSGLLMALAAPLVIGCWTDLEIFQSQWWEALAWVALVPLFAVIRGRSWKTAFKAGTIAGLIYFSVVLYWIIVALTEFGHIPYVAAIPILALLIVYCALYWGAAAALTSYISAALGFRFTLVAPLVFTALELVRNYALSGFPWGNIAYTQYKNLTIIQIASIAGVYGVTFLLTMSSAVVFEWFSSGRRSHRPRPYGSLVLFSMLVAATFFWGMHRSTVIEQQSKDAPRIKVGVLQGNIDQWRKSKSGEYRGSISSIYNRLTRTVVSSGVDLVIWPEAAYPVAVPEEIDSFDNEWSLLEPRKSTAHTLLGASVYKIDPQVRRLHNSAFLLDQSYSVISRFDKTHLVPFGEYVPLGLPIEKLVSGVGVYTPGSSPVPQVFMRGNKTVKLGPLICYEGIFPEISRELVNRGANLMVNITNDAWYGVTSAPYQHLSMYAFRSIETGRYLARAANTGVSAFIDPYGRINDRTKIFTEAAIVADLPLLETQTIYARFGDLLAYATLALVMLLLGAALVIHRTKSAL
jgi:apolipoprotein N-acyltransferase